MVFDFETFCDSKNGLAYVVSPESRFFLLLLAVSNWGILDIFLRDGNIEFCERISETVDDVGFSSGELCDFDGGGNVEGT